MGYTVSLEQQKAFIAEVAPLAQNAYKLFGKVKPSIAIGMACIESGYGWGSTGTRFMYKHNAVLGQKCGTGKTATKYWNGKFFTSKTSEEYKIGVHTVIKAAFRAYDDLQQCFMNYYELLNTSLYKKVLAESDYKTQMKQIKACGYMTSSTEVNSVLKCIATHNLTQYDNVDTNQNRVEVQKTINVSYDATITVKTNLRVRSGPGTAYLDVMVNNNPFRLPPGMKVTICEETADGKWGRLQDIQGWISLDYVTKQA